MRIPTLVVVSSVSTWFALNGSFACAPLRDLDGASAEYGSGGDLGNLGGDTAVGGRCSAEGAGGACSPEPGSCIENCRQPGCGDGIEQAGEACDDAGLSEACGSDCKPAACSPSCYCFSEHGSNYMLCTQSFANWLDSEATCEAYGMELAQVGSAWENDFLGYRVFKSNVLDAWLGATDAREEGAWRWMDGTNFWVGTSAGEPRGDAFTNWNAAQGEPNNAVDNDENCMRLQNASLWNDELCSQERPFLCEVRWPHSSDCGNGQLDGGEVCDSEGFSSSCDDDCTAPRCGDGVVNSLAGEECDDGNTDGLDACNSDCHENALVGYWPLLERNGTRAAELSGTGAPGTLTNCSFSDQLGLSLNNDATDETGPDNYVQAPARSELGFVGPFTLSVHAMPLGTASGVQTLLFRKGGGDEKLFLRLVDGSLQGGSIVTSSTDEYVIAADVGSSFGTATWSHFALTYDGSAYRLYSNGSQIAFRDTAVRAPVAAEMGCASATSPAAPPSPSMASSPTRASTRER